MTRQKVLLSKLTVFFKTRSATAQEWDNILFRLAFSTLDTSKISFSCHSVQCWHIVRSPECTCVHEYLRYSSFAQYQDCFRNSIFAQHVNSQLVESKQDVAQNCLKLLQFFISLAETGHRATDLSPFLPVYVCFSLSSLLY